MAPGTLHCLAEPVAGPRLIHVSCQHHRQLNKRQQVRAAGASLQPAALHAQAFNVQTSGLHRRHIHCALRYIILRSGMYLALYGSTVGDQRLSVFMASSIGVRACECFHASYAAVSRSILFAYGERFVTGVQPWQVLLLLSHAKPEPGRMCQHENPILKKSALLAGVMRAAADALRSMSSHIVCSWSRAEVKTSSCYGHQMRQDSPRMPVAQKMKDALKLTLSVSTLAAVLATRLQLTIYLQCDSEGLALGYTARVQLASHHSLDTHTCHHQCA